jgi:hypothetical protein
MHETSLSRKKEVRGQRDSVLIVTNGKCTEKQYFEALRRVPSVVAALRVIVKCVAPQALVAEARALRDANDYDHVWAVCDVDEFDVSVAIENAKAADVGLALSKPCFEVWLIFRKSDRCPGLNGATQAHDCLRKLIPSWQKERLDFADFRDGISIAVERAKKRGEPPEANPSTAVWRVIECVRGG